MMRRRVGGPNVEENPVVWVCVGMREDTDRCVGGEVSLEKHKPRASDNEHAKEVVMAVMAIR
jgi:hypothetical protein